MLNKVTECRIGDKTIHLVGTAHVSSESVDLVNETIEQVDPDVVAVELCASRMQALEKKTRWDEAEITQVLKQGQTHLFLTHLMLSNIQRRIGEDFGVKPGAEMFAAVDAARKAGKPIALVDRDVKITIKRALASMSLTEKVKLAFGFLEGIAEGEELDRDLLERLKEKDILDELMDELAREIPAAKEVLLDERNAYIASELQQIPAKTVVAVLGAGHIDGVVAELQKPHEPAMTASLTTVPKTRNWFKVVGYAVPVIFLLLILAGFSFRGMDVTLEMLKQWVLINGVFSAAGAALAFAHPATIVTAFLAAPITSLNPTIAAGWVAGVVELWVRKPRVKDFQKLLALNGLRDYWSNRVTRVVLVVAFANIGSSVGTFIALPYLASLI